MIITVTFNPITGTHLGTDKIYTNLAFNIGATIDCLMENIDEGGGIFSCDPEAITAGIDCGPCTTLTQSCNGCISIVNIDLEIDKASASIILTSGATASISGKFTSLDFDQTSVSYISKGSSDKFETPKVVSINVVPLKKDIFKISPDPRQTLTYTFTATATDSIGNSYVGTFTYTTQNDYSYIQTWINDYLGA